MADLTRFDLQVRHQIYDLCMKRGQPPLSTELSLLLDAPVEQVHNALTNLAEAHMLVLQRDNGEILMANPFSAVPTSFRVETPTFACYGNCIWDSLGIAAMLHQNVRIQTSCADCGSVLKLNILDEELHGDQSLIHFAIPARHWWDDIVFT